MKLVSGVAWQPVHLAERTEGFQYGTCYFGNRQVMEFENVIRILENV